MGKPLGPGTRRPDGAARREFEHGTAVYNPMGGERMKVTFNMPHTSLATGERARTHFLNAADGDIYLPRHPPGNR